MTTLALALPNLASTNISLKDAFASSISSIIKTPLPAAKPSAFKTYGAFNVSKKAVLKSIVKDNIVIIGAGGITSKESAVEKLNSGADLLQLYTGLVYFGLDLIREITEETN